MGHYYGSAGTLSHTCTNYNYTIISQNYQKQKGFRSYREIRRRTAKRQRDAIIRLLWKTERFLKEQGWSEAPRLPDRASGTYIEFRTCPCYGNKACIFIRNQKEMYSAYILKENLEFTLPLLLPKE